MKAQDHQATHTYSACTVCDTILLNFSETPAAGPFSSSEAFCEKSVHRVMT